MPAAPDLWAEGGAQVEDGEYDGELKYLRAYAKQVAGGQAAGRRGKKSKKSATAAAAANADEKDTATKKSSQGVSERAWPPLQSTWLPSDSEGEQELADEKTGDGVGAKRKYAKKRKSGETTNTNTLRKAQQGASVDLRLWRQFDFGNVLFEAYYREQD